MKIQECPAYKNRESFVLKSVKICSQGESIVPPSSSPLYRPNPRRRHNCLSLTENSHALEYKACAIFVGWALLYFHESKFLGVSLRGFEWSFSISLRRSSARE